MATSHGFRTLSYAGEDYLNRRDLLNFLNAAELEVVDSDLDPTELAAARKLLSELRQQFETLGISKGE